MFLSNLGKDKKMPLMVELNRKLFNLEFQTESNLNYLSLLVYISFSLRLNPLPFFCQKIVFWNSTQSLPRKGIKRKLHFEWFCLFG
jgi:hypothetical protein